MTHFSSLVCMPERIVRCDVLVTRAVVCVIRSIRVSVLQQTDPAPTVPCRGPRISVHHRELISLRIPGYTYRRPALSSAGPAMAFVHDTLSLIGPGD
jgi:hypothetical protein